MARRGVYDDDEQQESMEQRHRYHYIEMDTSSHRASRNGDRHRASKSIVDSILLPISLNSYSSLHHSISQASLKRRTKSSSTILLATIPTPQSPHLPHCKLNGAFVSALPSALVRRVSSKGGRKAAVAAKGASNNGTGERRKSERKKVGRR